MKNIILFFLFCFTSIQAQNITITGTIIDNDSNEPLEFATISFIAKGKQPQGGITDEQGKFKIIIAAGTYQINYEYITFKKITIENQTLSKDTDLGIIKMSQDIAELEAAVVIAEKTTVDIRLDKKIYNIGKDLTVRGGTVSDVLDNVPSVNVDVEGNVSLRGNDNVRILIDGRPSALVGVNSADALRQIPSEAIEKVEVITSPSARYDAEGTAGILNIILRKNKLKGFNGSTQVNTGYPENWGVSFNGNLRSKNINYFTNTGYRYRETPGNASSDIQYLPGSNAANALVQERRNFDRLGRNIFTSLGTEYFINKQSSIVGNLVYRLGNDNDVNSNDINRFSEDGSLNEATARREAESEDDERVQMTLDYKNDLDDNGQKLTASLQYATSLEKERGNITEFDIVNDELNDLERTLQTEDEQTALLQIDYELPIGENIQWEAGYRGNYRDITNTFYLEERLDFPNGPLVPDAFLNNSFNYKELVNAVYTQYGREWGAFSILTGLRIENTQVEITEATTSNESKKDYTNLFPTVNLGYELSKKASITLGYNRRIRRPRGRFLNPFPSRSSEASIFQGNVDLDPTISNGLDLGYLKRWDKFTLSTSIYANRSENNWEFIQQQTGQITDNGDPVIRRFPVNLSTQDRLGYELTLTYRPFKWWTINSDFNLFRVTTDGSFENQNFDFTNTTYNIRFNQKWSLPSKIDLQANFNYRGASANAQNTREGIGVLNLAASMDLFNEKATLTMNLSDVFNSRRRQGTTVTDDFISVNEFQWRERQLNLAFIYRFNQKKSKRNSNSSRGGDDFNFEG